MWGSPRSAGMAVAGGKGTGDREHGARSGSRFLCGTPHHAASTVKVAPAKDVGPGADHSKAAPHWSGDSADTPQDAGHGRLQHMGDLGAKNHLFLLSWRELRLACC